MTCLLIAYPSCTTCQKAKRWLEDNGVSFQQRSITEQNPTVDELRLWQQKSGLPLRRFFNTSGRLYQSLGLKDRLDGMAPEEQLALLATDGMLVKRPLLIGEDFVLTGFRPVDWEKACRSASV